MATETSNGTRLTIRTDSPDTETGVRGQGAITTTDNVIIPENHNLDVYEVSVAPTGSTDRDTSFTRPRRRANPTGGARVATRVEETRVTTTTSTTRTETTEDTVVANKPAEAFLLDRAKACRYLDITHWTAESIAYDQQYYGIYDIKNDEFVNRTSLWATKVCELRQAEPELWSAKLEAGGWSDQVKATDLSSCANELASYAQSCRAGVEAGELTSQALGN